MALANIVLELEAILHRWVAIVHIMYRTADISLVANDELREAVAGHGAARAREGLLSCLGRCSDATGSTRPCWSLWVVSAEPTNT